MTCRSRPGRGLCAIQSPSTSGSARAESAASRHLTVKARVGGGRRAEEEQQHKGEPHRESRRCTDERRAAAQLRDSPGAEETPRMTEEPKHNTGIQRPAPAVREAPSEYSGHA
ncbi:hypothetical protein NDU88_000337 [Pleurodeles waltl]|uniref:Uncharacterized protein n=1 Tax=Pleurodeles waltl TaxID=8319 RepID=A0AAV7TG03_PLEWA|nr:hypothetical protein NDU88_000337 [Pleurodeles waltl]